MERTVYIYQDSKYKPIMVYMDRPYPAGIYIGHFDTMNEAETAILEWKSKAKSEIPLCSALIDWRIDHGFYDMDGLTLLQEVKV